ncbi:MAG: hypothetical protein KGJ13_05810 [Patescibacteria group bacterium]|nr:hypothetical protein [Patescibacteria group bacterium]
MKSLLKQFSDFKTEFEICKECERMEWPQNSQPRYGINGETLCWSHAHLTVKPNTPNAAR